MLSPRPPAPAASASSPSVSTSSPVSVLPPSITTNSAPYQSCRSKSRDEFICQVADDSSSNLLQSIDPTIDAIGLLSNGTMSKTVLSCDTLKVPKSGLECVQCVEVFPDTMNHCVPDWDAAGREMDVIWEPTDLFSPSKGKWDSGHARKSDLGFVPEHDFEELCWEDGQLLVVMQGFNSKGNSKNRSCWQANVGEMAPLTSGTQSTAIDSAFDTLGTAELMDPSTLNMHSQEDELLSWLQHPPEDLVDKLAVPSDTVGPSTSVVNGEIMPSNDLTHCNIRRNRAFSEDLGGRSVSKNVRSKTFMTFPMNTLNKLGHDNHAVNQQVQLNTVAGCSSISTASMTSKEPCESGLVTARLGMPLPEVQSAAMAVPCSSPVQNASLSAMNFSNFSRPAVTFKANLHSLGMVNGPSGAERLKQLDRVSVDASKLESIDSTTKHLKLISPRKGGVALTASTIPQSIEGSNIHNSGQTVSLNRGSEQDASAIRAGNRCSANGVQSDGLNSSLISSTTFGLEGSTEVLEVTELSDSSSSGGSEDSDDIDGKRGASVGKRKSIDEDPEIQSKALENEATGSKKHAMGGGNSLKKSRAAENHNQSERRRRDRISEKMKALQALVPNSYKTDKASMLEEAISYIKALKAQIQMMSSRSGMYFSPVLMQQGMQPVQVAAWPHMGMGMGMNMGMGMSAGLGMFDMSMAMAAAAPRQFSPMLPFPGAVIPAVQTAASAALDSARLMHGGSSHVVAFPAPQVVVSSRPGVPTVSTRDSLPALNVVSPKIFSASQQQQQPVQGSNLQVGWMGGNTTNLSYPHQCLQPTAFMTGFGSLQQQ